MARGRGPSFGSDRRISAFLGFTGEPALSQSTLLISASSFYDSQGRFFSLQRPHLWSDITVTGGKG